MTTDLLHMRERIALVCTAACILMLAWGLRLHEMGKWNDDYWYCTDPLGTGGASLIKPLGFFFRPLYYIVVPMGQTVFWNHDWVLHLLSVAAHILACALFFWLLRKLKVGDRAAAWTTMLVGACPLAIDIVGWWSAVPTQLSWICTLGCLHLALAAMRSPSMRAVLVRALLAALAAFVGACLNEQPTAMLLGMPALLLVDKGPHTTVRRALGVSSLVGAACAAYVALMLFSAPPDMPGSVQNMTRSGEFFARATRVQQEFFRHVALERIGRPGLELAWAQLRQGALSAWAALAAALCAGAWALLQWRRTDSHCLTHPSQANHTARRWAIVLGMVLMAAGAMLPHMVLRQYDTFFRHAFFVFVPLTAAVVVMGQVAIGLMKRRIRPNESLLAPHEGGGAGSRGARSGARFAARLGAGAIALCVTAILALMSFGARSALIERWRMDNHIAQQLRQLFPSLPPDTALVAIRASDRPVHTSNPYFNFYFVGATHANWGIENWARRAFGRADIWGVPGYGHQSEVHALLPDPAADGAGAIRVRGHIGLPPPLPPPSAPDWTFRHDRVAAFVVADDGTVRAVGQIEETNPATGTTHRIAFPLAPAGSITMPR